MKNNSKNLEVAFVFSNFDMFLNLLRNTERINMFSFIWEREFFGENEHLNNLRYWAYEIITKTTDEKIFDEFVKKTKIHITDWHGFERLKTIGKKCVILKSLIYRLKDKRYNPYSSYDRNYYYNAILRTCRTSKSLSEDISSLILETAK